MDDSVTDLPPPDANDELLREGIQDMIFDLDESGLYFTRNGKRFYPHALSIQTIFRENNEKLFSWLMQEQKK